MTTHVLTDEQWELDGTVFGENTNVFIDGSGNGVDLGSADIRTQDTANTQRDGFTFGRDYINGPEIQFTLLAYKPGSAQEDSRWPDIKELAQVWRAGIRASQTDPSALSTLRWCRAGETVRTVGRPRKFDVTLANQKDNHLLRVTASFQRQGPDWMIEASPSGSANRLELNLTPPLETGGLVWSSDLTWPLLFTDGAVTPRAGVAVVDSWGPCPFKVQVYGPAAGGRLNGFKLAGPGWVLESSADLAYDQSAVIDTYAGTFTRGSSSLANTLSIPSDLYAQLQPGNQSLSFSAGDATGTARAVVTWYNTMSA